MSITQLKRTAGACFWGGVVMTLACIAVVPVAHTKLFWRLERKDFPLSWAFAGLAAIAFLATEFCHSVLSRTDKATDQNSQPTLSIDQNGKISKQEFMGVMEAEFDRLDKDKNGELEVKALRASRLLNSAKPATASKPRPAGVLH
jgi:hypothetical protein